MEDEVEKLMERATGGGSRSENSFQPGTVYQLLKDPFWIWCEFHVDDEKAVDETTLYDEYMMKRGVAWEDEWVQEN